MKLFKGLDWILIALSVVFLLYIAANDLINLLSEKTTDIGIPFSNGMILGFTLLFLSGFSLANKHTGNLVARAISYSLLGYFLFLTCVGDGFHPIQNKYVGLFILGLAAYSLIFRLGTSGISVGLSIFWAYLIAHFHEGSIETLFHPSYKFLIVKPSCMIVIIICLIFAIAFDHYNTNEARKDKRSKEKKGGSYTPGTYNGNNSNRTRRPIYNNGGQHHHHHHDHGHDHYESEGFTGTPVEDWDFNFGPINNDGHYDSQYD
ncbi:hypothetical protein [Priestia megaterium]|uniref:Uncharacterized protein n=1 Tax=Priestia megaterium TaxID=1404 RepID=A0A6M6E1N0_PRIMG|nr:hypothetical protein [Priestia megaterium]QJX80951.1 hypothetical protein FDZ14_33210 [Priestia megaterium]